MFCKYCGNEIEDDAAFCKKCGKRILTADKRQSTKPAAARDGAKVPAKTVRKKLSAKQKLVRAFAAILIMFFSLQMAFRLSGKLMQDHYTLLMDASAKNRVHLAKVLLFFGADVNAKYAKQKNEQFGKYADGETALDIAVMEGNIEIVKTLIEKGAQIESDSGPLHSAVMRGWPDIVSLLIKSGADVNAYPNGGDPGMDFLYTPLNEIITSSVWGKRPADMEKCTRLLIENGAYMDLQSKYTGVNILHLLAGTPTDCYGISGGAKALAVLLSYGADVNIRDYKGKTPLMCAAEYDNDSVAKVLLDNGADIWAKDKQGRTALMIAKADPFGYGTFKVANLITEYMNKR